MGKDIIINGIDVSEEIRYCNNCSNLGLDFKTHKFYCSLSHRPDELPEVLSCDEFCTNCYIKRLQEENGRLNQELDIKEKMFDKFMIGSGETLEKLQKENEELKARLQTLDDEVLTVEITPEEFERIKKYKQALEEIRNEIGDLKDINRLINLQKILDKINEVLNDRN